MPRVDHLFLHHQQSAFRHGSRLAKSGQDALAILFDVLWSKRRVEHYFGEDLPYAIETPAGGYERNGAVIVRDRRNYAAAQTSELAAHRLARHFAPRLDRRRKHKILDAGV